VKKYLAAIVILAALILTASGADAAGEQNKKSGGAWFDWVLKKEAPPKKEKIDVKTIEVRKKAAIVQKEKEKSAVTKTKEMIFGVAEPETEKEAIDKESSWWGFLEEMLYSIGGGMISHIPGLESGSVDVNDVATNITSGDSAQLFPKVNPQGNKFLFLDITDAMMIKSAPTLDGKIQEKVRIENSGSAMSSLTWTDDGELAYIGRNVKEVKNKSGQIIDRKTADFQLRIQAPEQAQSQAINLDKIAFPLMHVTMLSDGSIIGTKVRKMTRKEFKATKVGFKSRKIIPLKNYENNWSFNGFQTEVVRIWPNGKILSYGRGTTPAVSNDETRVVFSRENIPGPHVKWWKRKVYYNLYIADVDKGVATRLTQRNSNDVQPVWAQDDAGIVFSTNFSEGHPKHPKRLYDLSYMPMGEKPFILIDAGSNEGGPSVDRKGNLYFHSNASLRFGEGAWTNPINYTLSTYHIWKADLNELRKKQTQDKKSNEDEEPVRSLTPIL